MQLIQQACGCFVPNHNCIDNQIHTFAGVRLRLECNEKMKDWHGELPTGEAFLTKGYNLPAQYVIHAVGPAIQYEVTEVDQKELANCYIHSLELAVENNLKTIAFPCISTGVFRFPKELASQIAIQTVDDFLDDHKEQLDKVVFNLWSEEDVRIYERSIKEN